jgi:hypothetical protein
MEGQELDPNDLKSIELAAQEVSGTGYYKAMAYLGKYAELIEALESEIEIYKDDCDISRYYHIYANGYLGVPKNPTKAQEILNFYCQHYNCYSPR